MLKLQLNCPHLQLVNIFQFFSPSAQPPDSTTFQPLFTPLSPKSQAIVSSSSFPELFNINYLITLFSSMLLEIIYISSTRKVSL